jgi:queuine tRNA-ribosyltransferase
VNDSFAFAVVGRDSGTAARAGLLSTPHGDVETPSFLPVGTQATVKALAPDELREVGVQIVLANAYHLHLRPGEDVVAEAGGLHRFSGWDGPILTDSGGFQVFSQAPLVKVDEDGVTLRSHLDGSLRRLTPESVVDLQRALGSDVTMPLDHCLPNPAPRAEAGQAVERTLRWLERSIRRTADGDGPSRQALFGIVQGATHADLRRASARATRDLGPPGFAVGGLAVGEPRETLLEILEVLEPELGPESPRHLMGVGFPEDLVEAVARGMDLFDCVAPTRHGRTGALFTREGRINLRSAVHRRNHGPIDPDCGCAACSRFSRAYLAHLVHAGEILGLRLATYHNVAFVVRLLREARTALLEGRFGAWRAAFHERWTARRPSGTA